MKDFVVMGNLKAALSLVHYPAQEFVSILNYFWKTIFIFWPVWEFECEFLEDLEALLAASREIDRK